MMNDNYLNRGMDNLKKLIHETGFGEIEAELLNYSRPSIRVETTAVENEDELAIGQSKIGGRPDLPKNMKWVETNARKGGMRSLPFLAQIDLDDVKAYDVENLLPETGMLYFFGGGWEFAANPIHDVQRVIYYNGDKSVLERKAFPHDLPPTPPMEWGDDRFEPCSLKFFPEVNLNNVVDPFTDKVAGKTWRDLYDLVDAAAYTRPRPPFIRVVHRLLGFTHDIPEDMQLSCQLVEDTGRFHNFTPDEIAAAQAKKFDWQLLFQIDSDDKANMSWSDNGTICFYIKKQDLANKNFDNVRLMFFTS